MFIDYVINSSLIPCAITAALLILYYELKKIKNAKKQNNIIATLENARNTLNDALTTFKFDNETSKKIAVLHNELNDIVRELECQSETHSDK